jgi:hypothetical protein
MRVLIFALVFVFAVQLLGAEVTPPRVLGSNAATNPFAGIPIELTDRDLKFTLFVPDGWTASSTNVVCMHFHTVAATVIRQHLHRGAREPLAVFVLGSGSTAYRKPFEDSGRFARVVSLIEGELTRRAAAPVKIAGIDVSSFSAGYGAVRELVQLPAGTNLIRRIVLLDSLYGGLEPQAGSTNRIPLAEHIQVWEPFARAAVRGGKTFLITTSDVPTPNYAGTRECAEALLKRLGLQLTRVTNDGPSLSSFTLQGQADSGNFHVWSYSGTNGAAHMAHVQNMAHLWQALGNAASQAP